MNKEVNKSWTYEAKENHVELKWREHIVLIDHRDFHYFLNNVFRILHGSVGGPYLYMIERVNGKNKYKTFHRIVINAKGKEKVDHINMKTLDNRLENLRVCNHSQNTMNSKKRTSSSVKYTSKFKGVHKNKKGKWVCLVGPSDKRERYIFDNEIDAAHKYNERAFALFGEFAILNQV